jgi:hypothetical protein
MENKANKFETKFEREKELVTLLHFEIIVLLVSVLIIDIEREGRA